MQILFSEIYAKSIGLFDDPKITKAYKENQIQFNKLMYTFLQNSISLFNNPISIAKALSNYTEPLGQMEVFVSDGTNTTFQIDPEFNLSQDSIYEYIANGKIVSGKIDFVARTVTFPSAIPQNTEFSVQGYYPGAFNITANSISQTSGLANLIRNQIKDILARLLIKSWGEEKRNFLVDIQNILNDTEFKVHPASNALKAKDAWVAQLDKEILQYQNKLSWNLRITG